PGRPFNMAMAQGMVIFHEPVTEKCSKPRCIYISSHDSQDPKHYHRQCHDTRRFVDIFHIGSCFTSENHKEQTEHIKCRKECGNYREPEQGRIPMRPRSN